MAVTVSVCTAQPCAHDGSEQKHDRDHVLCEHCTVPVVWCRTCHAVPDMAVEKELVGGGWVRTKSKQWYCPNCPVVVDGGSK